MEEEESLLSPMLCIILIGIMVNGGEDDADIVALFCSDDITCGQLVAKSLCNNAVNKKQQKKPC